MAPAESEARTGESGTPAFHSTSPSVASAGLDWVTVTGRTGDSANALLAFGRRLVADEVRAGNRAGPVGGHGYVGNRAGQAAWGHRREDVMVTLTGPLAYRWGPAALQMADTAARVDVQATIRLPTDDAQRLIWHARYRPEGAKERGKPITRRLIDDSGKGLTCYLGSPKSPQLGRVYDKHRESPAAYEAGHIRYEVQQRRRYADLWRRIAQTDGIHSAYVAASIRAWFRRRGVELPAATGPGEALSPPPPVPTDFERMVSWLATGVAPSLRRWETPEQRRAIAKALGILE